MLRVAQFASANGSAAPGRKGLLSRTPLAEFSAAGSPSQSLIGNGWKHKGSDGSLFAEQLLEIFDEADKNDHGRARQANEKHQLEQSHQENGEDHGNDCKPYPGSFLATKWKMRNFRSASREKSECGLVLLRQSNWKSVVPKW
jgi:hypothetical protein